MEILKKGIIENLWIGKCLDCNTIVECPLEEIKTITNVTLNNLTFIQQGVSDCPCCNIKGNLILYKKSEQISKDILSDLFEKR